MSHGILTTYPLVMVVGGFSFIKDKMTLKHGYSKRNKIHYLYILWKTIKQKCYNKKSSGFYKYGARGIKLYAKWHEFIPFKNYIEKYLGKKPNDYSLDRIDNKKGYYPGNLRWANNSQQQRNTRKNYKIIRINRLGVIRRYNCLSEAIDEGFNHGNIISCINKTRKTHKKYKWFKGDNYEKN